MIGAVKSLTSQQHRGLERQQVLTSQRRFNIGGLRSDQIVRAQYEQKLERLKYENILLETLSLENCILMTSRHADAVLNVHQMMKFFIFIFEIISIANKL